jgi:hypothetical protein
MESEDGKIIYRRSVTITPGKPIEIVGPIEASHARPASPLSKAMATTLKAYVKAGRELLDGAFTSVRDLAPPNLRVPCHTYVICCPDGVLVRYDAAEGEEPKVRSADHPESLARVAPLFPITSSIAQITRPPMFLNTSGHLWRLVSGGKRKQQSS